jgi:NADPH:quinone reductase-like Zn-dependent oxidoreductase
MNWGGDSMKAIVQDQYGSADVLKLEDIEKPAVGKGQVILRVRAASVFIGDWHMMTGTPYAIRLVSGLRAPKQRILGQDLAGTVEAVGDGVTGFRAATRCSARVLERSPSTQPHGPTGSRPSRRT